ncbi:hypothetical protein PsorP6_014535 [Peronosclerospora sorghi]|uniref:Uncharacterized protein n=1 Tax=Peronosclerospora sorghi TaxID=230839 RepID=A0ACC0VSI6_9STRA|nr:hypothetical protein PsorP6_014535 [Peronosclerospora sorghi]
MFFQNRFTSLFFIPEQTRHLTEQYHTNSKEEFPTIRPRVFITDKEDALINAIEDQYPDSRRLLCGWHIKKNLAARYERSFTQEARKQFIKEWEQLCETCDEEEFDAGWEELQEKIRHRRRLY